MTKMTREQNAEILALWLVTLNKGTFLFH